MSRKMMGWLRSHVGVGHGLAIASLCALAGALGAPLTMTAAPAPPADQSSVVFKDVPVEYDQSVAEGASIKGVIYRRWAQMIERTVDLPPRPVDQRDARRILVSVTIKPMMTGSTDKNRPGDPWTRVGSVRVLKHSADGSATPPSTTRPAATTAPATQPASTSPPTTEPEVPNSADEIELMRFITPFGGEATYTQDVTSLTPLLGGRTTIRLYLTSHMKPAWSVSLKFDYSATGVGYRRPVWATPLFLNEEVRAEQDTLRTTIEVPWGLDRPRLRILTTGHATDGTGGDEFISRSHVLKIDGKEVARWRPWVEEGGDLRAKNPWSGRGTFEGRERWSSDLDRSGWHPGQVVDPVEMPVPELTPGRHAIELKIEGIRPKDANGWGYWRISAVAVADEPWPAEDPPTR